MDYLNSSVSLVDILLKEFKGLNYGQQTSQEGMLFLLSAFTHAEESKNILEYLIGFLERGSHNQGALENLYNYYFERYGEVYTEKDVKDLNISELLKLNRSITLEKKREKERLLQQLESSQETTIEKETVDEQYKKLIKRTKIKRSTKNAFDLE